MAVFFLSLAQACAPTIAPATLAAIVTVESGMASLAIRVNSTYPFKDQPTTKPEAIEMATTLISEGQDLDLGLGGINTASLPRLGLSISDAFDPCLNLKATAKLLEEYRVAAVSDGGSPADTETAMLQSYYGQGDASVGKIVGYDRRIRMMEQRLLPRINELTLAVVAGPVLPSRESVADGAGASLPSDRAGVDETHIHSKENRSTDNGKAPAWDVFKARLTSTVLVFSKQQQE